MKLKKLIALAAVAALCLCLVSCGGERKLRCGKSVKIKYVPDGPEQIFRFSAPRDGEYTFRHTAQGSAAVCGAYADEACTELLLPLSRADAFCFSLEMAKGDPVWLKITAKPEAKVKGTLQISEYKDDPDTDVNYGHALDLTEGEPLSAGTLAGGVPVLYSFTAPGAGVYSFSADGDTPCSFRFYEDGRCTRPIEQVNDTSYPDEHFRLRESVACCTGRQLETDETVYFTLTAAEDSEVCTVTAAAACHVPDAVSAAEQFSYLTSSLGVAPYLLIQEDPEKTFRYGIGNCYIAQAADPVSSCDIPGDADIDGVSLLTYLSSSELTLLQPGFFSIYETRDIQSAIDGIWGSGRIEAKNFTQPTFSETPSARLTTYSSSLGYTFNLEGFGDDGIIPAYRIKNVKVNDAYTAVTIVGCYYNYFAGEVFDLSSFFGIEKMLGSAEVERSSASLDSLLERCGAKEEDLTPIDLIFYCTRSGLRLWNAVPVGTPVSPLIPNSEPRLPEIVPGSFTAEKRMTVTADGGLRLRGGPGTDFDTILILETGTEIRTYGEQDGWVYARFAGRYGWCSADYLEDALQS